MPRSGKKIEKMVEDVLCGREGGMAPVPKKLQLEEDRRRSSIIVLWCARGFQIPMQRTREREAPMKRGGNGERPGVPTTAVGPVVAARYFCI